jgi:hypothetical protein
MVRRLGSEGGQSCSDNKKFSLNFELNNPSCRFFLNIKTCHLARKLRNGIFEAGKMFAQAVSE